jgi:hypothetical protein
MKEKCNWNEIEARLNFESVCQKLLNLSASGKLKRRKSAGDLLDKVKDALLKARSDGVSIASLASFLTENGLPVSEPTLRNYLHAQGAHKRRWRRKSATIATPSVPEPQPKSQPDARTHAKPETLQKPTPTASAIQSLIDKHRSENVSSDQETDEGGPHIVDLTTL